MKIYIFLIILIYSSFCFTLFPLLEDQLRTPKITFPSKNGVIILTTETIDEAIKTYPKLIIFMYATWCPHCQEMHPEYEAASQSKEIKNMGVIFASIDIEFHSETASKFNITGYPTLFYFENGKFKEIFGGNREKNAIIEWFRKRIISVSIPINSLNEIKNNYENTTTHKFIYFGQNKTNIKIYENYALNQDFIFGLCKDKNLIKQYGKIEPETVVLYKPFDNPNYVTLKNDITENSIDQLLKENSYPLIWNLTDLISYSFPLYEPSMVFFRKTNNLTEMKILDDNYQKIAKKFKNKILFGLADTENDYAQKILNVINSTTGNYTPTAVIFDFKKNFYQFKFEDYFKEYTNENLEKFVQNWVEKIIKPPARSEKIPEKHEEGKVYKVVYDSFQKDVIDNKLNVFVKFYSPYCPHCIKVAPIYEEVAEKLKMNKNIRIAEYNMADNDFDLFKISGFPTFVMFKAGEKDKHIFYEGNRTASDIIKFILINQGFPTLKKKEENKKNDGKNTEL